MLPHALELRAVAETGQRRFDAALKTIALARRLAGAQGNVHTEVNGVVLAARVHLSRASPERALDVLGERDARFTSPGMEGEYLATHALALACSGKSDAARALAESSDAVSGQVDAVAIRKFAMLIAGYYEGGKIDPALLIEAFETTSSGGNFAARSYAPIAPSLRFSARLRLRRRVFQETSSTWRHSSTLGSRKGLVSAQSPGFASNDRGSH